MINCVQCNQETTNPKFCCKSCSAMWTNKNYPKKKTKRKCIQCSGQVATYRDSRCPECKKKHIEETENRKHMTIKEYINKDSVKGKHPSWKHAHIRGIARVQHKDILKLPCINCGYHKHVELCHIIPISAFDENTTLEIVNHKHNVIQLCPNCHWEFDNRLLILQFSLEVKVWMEGIEPTLTPITVSPLEEASGTSI